MRMARRSCISTRTSVIRILVPANWGQGWFLGSRSIRSNLVFGRRYRRSSWSSRNLRHEIPVTCSLCRDFVRAASRAVRTVPSEMTLLPRSGKGDFIGDFDLVVVVRDRLPGDASKATKASLRGANNPDRGPALATNSGAVGVNGRLHLLGDFDTLGAWVCASVQFDIVAEADWRKTSFHERAHQDIAV